MKYIKTYEGLFNLNENITSASYGDNMNFIKDLESDIKDIFIDVLDFNYDIHFHLTDYGGNVSNITIKASDSKSLAPIDLFLESIHHLYDYVSSASLGSYIIDICINGKWIQSKYGMTWEYIEECIINRPSFALNKDSGIYSLVISIGPLNKKK